MGIFDGLISPAAVGGAFSDGLRTGRAEREEREVKGALSAYAVNPDDPQAFQTLAQVRPELAIRIGEDQRKRQQQAQVAELQRRAASGDKPAMAQLAGIDLDAWDKLADNDRQAVKQQVDYIGQSALQILRLPPEARPAAWDQAVEQGISLGYNGLAAQRGQYSEQALQGAISNAGQVGKFIEMTEPKYQTIPEGGTLVNTNDPRAVQSFVSGSGSPPSPAAPPARVNSIDEAKRLPPGTKFIDPNGIERIVPGGQTATPSGNFPGLVTPGNIDLHNRPVVRNRDGSISTVRSMSIGTDEGEVLIPTVSPDGHIWSDEDAVASYRRSGKHLGIFKTPAEATAYAKSLSQQQAREYGSRSGSFADFKRAIIGQETGGRYGIPNAEGSGAMGIGQQMPETAKALAARLGLPWKPALMKGTSAEARAYQDKITDAALKEAWEAGGGNLRTAAMYYHGGSNRGIWGPKTQRYAENILARMRPRLGMR